MSASVEPRLGSRMDVSAARLASPGGARQPRPPSLGPVGQKRRPGRRRPGWRGLALAWSLLLHLVLGWWLLFGFERRPVQEPAAPSAMDVVFEGGSPEEMPAPPESTPSPLEPPEAAALPSSPSIPPPVEAPPLAEAPPAPPAPPPPVAPPPVAPPSAPPLAQPVPPPLAQTAPVPLPALPAPSELSLPPPPPPAETAERTETAALPLPPPPAPEPPPAPPETVLARPAPPQPAQRPRPASPFAGALDLSQGPPISLGRPVAPPRPSAPGSSSARRDRQAAEAMTSGQADAPNAQLRIRGAQLGADWRSAFMAWLRQHGYYPRQAVEAGEDGTAIVRFTVDRSGRVSGLQLIGRSGSIWLDAGAQALLRNQIVPPFPPDTQEDSAEIDLTINYILRRR